MYVKIRHSPGKSRRTLSQLLSGAYQWVELQPMQAHVIASDCSGTLL